MYFFRDDTAPNDLLWESIDASGALGTETDSPYHESAPWTHPIRVSPDGARVLVGTGRLFDAITLQERESLSNNIAEAAWLDGKLITARDYGGTQLQRWSSNYQVEATGQLSGAPLALHKSDQGLLVVTTLRGQTQLALLNSALEPIYELRFYATYLPSLPARVPVNSLLDADRQAGRRSAA
jgi:hypothetical protein